MGCMGIAVGGTRKNGAGGPTGVGGTGNGAGVVGCVDGIEGSGPSCTADHAGTYIGCCWGVAKKGG